jgi:hypothetical protein
VEKQLLEKENINTFESIINIMNTIKEYHLGVVTDVKVLCGKDWFSKLTNLPDIRTACAYSFSHPFTTHKEYKYCQLNGVLFQVVPEVEGVVAVLVNGKLNNITRSRFERLVLTEKTPKQLMEDEIAAVLAKYKGQV